MDVEGAAVVGGGADRLHGVYTDDAPLRALYGERFTVNSAHHQCVDRLGDGLRAAAWSEDGVIEACRHKSLPVYSVQWHPERMCLCHTRADTVDGGTLFRWFIGQIMD